MAIDFLHHINLNQNEAKQLVFENITTTNIDAMKDAITPGQVLFNTTVSKFQFWDGTNWINLGEKLTESEVRAMVSATDAGGDGSFTYDNSSGVFTYTGPSASETRAHFSGGTGITLKDGEIISDITQYADADVQSYLSAGTGVSLSASGEFSIGQAVGTSDNVSFGDIDSSGDVVVKGNLTVQGSTVSVNQTEINVTNAFVFEGSKADEFETTLSIIEPTKDQTIQLPDATGTIALTSQVRTDEQIEDLVGDMVATNAADATGSDQSGISVTYDDANGKLDFNVLDPTITLTGAVTGSGTITNLGDVSIATTPAKNHAYSSSAFPPSDAKTFSVTHGLSTLNVIVSIVKGGKVIYADVTIKDKDTLTIDFAKNQAAKSITVNVLSAAV